MISECLALELFFQKVGLEKVIAEGSQLFLSIQETLVLKLVFQES